MNTLAARMTLISVGILGTLVLLFGNLFLDYDQGIIKTVLPVVLLVALGLVLISLTEYFDAIGGK